jgi:hypothetical protein
MTMPDADLTQLLNRLDTCTEPLDEHIIFSEICRTRPEIANTLFRADFFEASAEALAFHIDEPFDGLTAEATSLFVSLRESGAWGRLTDKHGQILEYWAERARAAKHPVLRARYAGLAWEFGEPPDILMAHTRIDSVLAMARDKSHDPIDVLAKLGHTLGLAIRINDDTRTEAVRDAIIALEQEMAVDDQIGTWGRAFDLLCENGKSRITEEQRDKIILELEGRLERISDPAAAPGTLDPWGSEAAARRLARHYRRNGQTREIRRVLAKVERAFEVLAAKADPLLAQAWLMDVEKLYREFGISEEASRLRIGVRGLGPGALGKLVGFRHKFEIKKEEMDQYVGKMVEGDELTVVRRFILEYIPRRQETEHQLKRLSSTTPEVFFSHRTVMDSKGRPSFSLGSLQHDLEGHVFLHTKQDIELGSIFMRHVVEAMISRFSLDAAKVLIRVDGSPVFDSGKRPIMERALKAYFEREPMLFLHLAVPQIESAIREMAQLLGIDTYRPNRTGGMDLRNMDDLLRDPQIVNSLTADAADYFRVLYTDKRGINLRNDLCHGMLPGEAFHLGLADRVFHTLLLLTVFKATTAVDGGPKPNNAGASA